MKYRFVVTAVQAFTMIVCASSTGRAQSGHAAYVEAGGSGVLATANYEWQPTQHLALRLGIGALPLGANDAAVVFPLGGAALIPLCAESAHHLEFGGNVGIVPIDYGGIKRFVVASPSVYLVPVVGYRFQPEKLGESGLLLRASITPLITLTHGVNAQLWGGVSIGYLFR